MSYLANVAVALEFLPHLRRVRDHIDRHYTEPLTLDQLAAVGAVSKFHLIRSFAVAFASLGSFSGRFKQLVGETPTGYRDRWARTGAPHIPGCYLFMRGVVDLRTTSNVSGSDEVPQSRRSARPATVLKS